MAAYLRNAPPAYECKPMTGALPSLSHPFPSRCSFDPRLAQRHDGERGRARHAQPRAVYPQSIKDDRQHEYQQRRQLPAAGHGIARFCDPVATIYPTRRARTCALSRVHSSLLHPRLRQPRYNRIFQASSVHRNSKDRTCK